MNDIVNRLQQSVSLERTFFEYCTCVAKSVPLDRAGLAQLTPDGQQFEVIAEWDASMANAHSDMSPETIAPVESRRFARAGTVGDFVLRKGEVFVGPTIDAVRKFPATQESLKKFGFNSNYVAPLGGDSGRVLYLLSTHAGGLGHEGTAEIAGSLTYLSELLNVALRLQTLYDYERALDAALAEFLTNFVRAQGRYPKLSEIEGSYLRHVSKTAHYRVEGLQGGASLSGLKPSTLRYRLERLETAKRDASR